MATILRESKFNNIVVVAYICLFDMEGIFQRNKKGKNKNINILQ